MAKRSRIKSYYELPTVLRRLMPVLGALISMFSFLYIAQLYNQPEVLFVHWVRMGIFLLITICSLYGALYSFFHPGIAWRWILAGLSLVPILLILQLVIVLLQGIRKALAAVLDTPPQWLVTFIENNPSIVDISVLGIIGVGALVYVAMKLLRVPALPQSK